jgi:hypothetical protein
MRRVEPHGRWNVATLTIEDRTATGTPIGHIDLPDMPDRITLRDLIRLRVGEEVARYNLKPVEAFHGLVQPDGAVPLGRLGFRLPKPRRLDWEKQAEIACDSFERNGFFVLVNGTQVTELDDTIELVGAVDVGFIKLTPLVGG